MTSTDYGKLRADEDRLSVHFERLYDATADELWSALTDPEQLPGWLAHATRFQLEVGGAVDLDFGDGDEVHGEIRELEPGRLLEYTWDEQSVVRFELVPREHGVLLLLDHRGLTTNVGVEYGAGWHAHLDMLAARLAGARVDFTPRYEGLRPSYEERVAALP
jgi:uncharacterized protein YndB with AHSA1/START domain